MKTISVFNNVKYSSIGLSFFIYPYSAMKEYINISFQEVYYISSSITTLVHPNRF